ncbi:hypothetical protein HYC85_025774 [Camellia sinensis]|uniref:J domain-containing protein n=1 Tax=Camellia sinensis TaxID=4442 RepID=A0A7J7GFV1_CAMSI|nr:hypothetical protein HYC85_025774 [Camellia sinensis]
MNMNMNRAAARPALLNNSQSNPFNIRAALALFHSTPLLDRRRRTHWDSGGGAYRDSSKSWQNGFDEYDPSSSQGSSTFRREYGAKETFTSAKMILTLRPFFDLHLVETDTSIGPLLMKTFLDGGVHQVTLITIGPLGTGDIGMKRIMTPQQSQTVQSQIWQSDRLALGLSAYGPLKLEDVKNAYRVCALKWHPDRHQGSSKACSHSPHVEVGVLGVPSSVGGSNIEASLFNLESRPKLKEKY